MVEKAGKKTTPRKIPHRKEALDSVEANDTEAQNLTDRIIKTGTPRKKAACPKCKAFPTVLKIRRQRYELRKCRVCGHIFEIIKDQK